MLSQSFCEGSPGHSQRRRIQRQFEGFAVRSIDCQRHCAASHFDHFIQLPAQKHQLPTAGIEPKRIPLRKILIAPVERLQDQIGRAGRAKQSQRVADRRFFLHRRFRAKMQIGSAREDRQRFVSGIAAHRRAQRDGMPTSPDQKVQICSMGVVHQKRNAVSAADTGKCRDVLHPAEVIRAGDVDAKGSFPLLCQTVQRHGELFLRHGAAAQRTGSFRRGPEPLDVKIEQRRRIQQRLVRIARGQKERALTFGGRLHRQTQHGPDALRRPLRTIISMRRPKQAGRIGFALGDDAFGLVQLVRTFDLRDIVGFEPQQILPLMPGHMEPGGSRTRVVPHKIYDRRGHAHSAQASPSAQALQVLPSSMGTSMPCAASS